MGNDGEEKGRGPLSHLRPLREQRDYAGRIHVRMDTLLRANWFALAGLET